MDVVEVWNGHHACALQAALRMTNEAFADHLGIAPRTVATWHTNSDVVLRRETQQLLDEVYETASPTVRKRFALMRTSDQLAAGRGNSAAQALRVAIAVVVREDQVLLVCRRDDGASGITWQFPAGVVKPGVHPDSAAVRETLNETGVRCAVIRNLGARLHPVTAVECEYFLCEFLAGEATNSDVVENVDVMWAPKASVTRFIPASNIFPPILAALEEPHDAADHR
ncbi:NUDIX domain-containing protein [Streptomyces bottropensis]|uniref:NUDIX domain-containing protein n=1 Tax=Streptomyces bottropensis TaxID=42235 RepID=UPI0036A26FE9